MEKLKKLKIDKKIYRKLPTDSGVYVFWQNNTPIYIGKAFNLKSRVTSYFGRAVIGKIKNMVNNANYISYIVVDSEFQATLLEAELIKKYKPKYNIIQKDDKSELYIKITKDKYPIIKTVRKNELDNSKNIFGPYRSKKTALSILKKIRWIIPYATHKLGYAPCLYSQMGLCNPCPNMIEKEKGRKKEQYWADYKRNIGQIKRILKGNLQLIKIDYINKMHTASKNENYKKALFYKNKIRMIEELETKKFSISEYLANPNLTHDLRLNEIRSLKKDIPNIGTRIIYIECFDVAHISGSFTSASLVTFKNGNPIPSLYKHFRIRSTKKQSDFHSIKEVAQRRAKNIKNWGLPDLIIVDGGKSQVKAFFEVFQDKCPVVGYAKLSQRLVIPISKENKIEYLVKSTKRKDYHNLLLRLTDEAHRFARRYHHTLIRKQILNK